jgi:hypothetical protein
LQFDIDELAAGCGSLAEKIQLGGYASLELTATRRAPAGRNHDGVGIHLEEVLDLRQRRSRFGQVIEAEFQEGVIPHQAFGLFQEFGGVGSCNSYANPGQSKRQKPLYVTEGG